MKKVTLSVALLATLSLWPTSLHAKAYNMVFWYPGEAGSTAEAEPVLADFFDYVGSKLGASFSGKYFNTSSDGLVYIKKTRPQLGILSWIALMENKGTLPPHGTIAQTLPLPHGSTKDQFSIVGYKSNNEGQWVPPENLVVYSSIPVSLALLRSSLIPDIKGNISIHTTRTMLMTLKKIASEENPNEVALLTPMEKYTLDNLKGDWTNKLTMLHKCSPTPTAPLIYFGEKPEITERLIKVLTAMRDDPEGKEILETLRLKGFQPVN